MYAKTYKIYDSTNEVSGNNKDQINIYITNIKIGNYWLKENVSFGPSSFNSKWS